MKRGLAESLELTIIEQYGCTLLEEVDRHEQSRLALAPDNDALQSFENARPDKHSHAGLQSGFGADRGAGLDQIADSAKITRQVHRIRNGHPARDAPRLLGGAPPVGNRQSASRLLGYRGR